MKYSLVATLVLILLVIATNSNAFAASTNLTYFKSLDLIRKVLELVKSDYVDENIDDQKLFFHKIPLLMGI